MSVLRSFFVPQGTREGAIDAPVERFLGVAIAQHGVLVLAQCAGAVPRSDEGPRLLDPRGVPLARSAPAGDRYRLFVALEGEDVPMGTDANGLPQPAEFLGGVASTPAPGAWAGAFIYALRERTPRTVEPLPAALVEPRPGEHIDVV